MGSLVRCAAGAAILALIAGRASPAPDYVGGTKCFNCHKLGRKAWQDSHAQTLAQLAEPRAAEYARATGGDARHPKCLACHAPVTVAGAAAAVSCESCHGPAKEWIVPHQESAFYAAPPAQWMGLRNLHKNSREIARICVECHVVNDKAIAAAGHPVGASFDAGRDMASPKMAHWPSGTTGDARVRAYDRAFYAAVSRDGAPLVASRSAGMGSTTKAAGGAAPRPVTAVAGTATRAAPPAATTRPVAPAATGGDEYADLGDDEFVNAGSAAAAAPATPAIAPAPAPPRPKPRPIERLALPDAPSGAFERAPVRVEPPPAAASVPLAPAVTAPRPPAAKPRSIAEARGRAALALADLIRQKKRLDLPPPAPPAGFAGPDGELLRLQDEVLALALATLRRSR